MKLGLAQLNTRVGAIDANANKVLDYATRARDEHGCDLVLFPELTLCGYPPEDLLLHRGLRARVEAAFAKVRDSVRGIAVYLGYPEYVGDAIYNSAALHSRRPSASQPPQSCAAELRGVRREALLPARRRRDGSRSRWLAPRPDHLRGRLVAGALPRAGRGGRAGDPGDQRLAVPHDAAVAARAGPRRARDRELVAADLSQHGRRPGRARLRRRLGRRGRRGRGAFPRAAVRGRAVRRRARPRRRQARAARRRTCSRRRRSSSASIALWCSARGTTSRRTAFAASCSGCRAASTRRSRSQSRSTRSAPSACMR